MTEIDLLRVLADFRSTKRLAESMRDGLSGHDISEYYKGLANGLDYAIFILEREGLQND